MKRLFIALVLLSFSAPARAQIVVERAWPEEWPMDPAPITASRWPALPPAPPAEPSPTTAGARVLSLLEQIRRSQTDSAYQHRTDVRERIGRYRWDCSGL